ncbi:MAG: hypothetical protein MN733_17350, partial [Nitrososphaera sp.]|nr:hypothetical protein [Nitrososphaera sp.]
MNQKGMHYRSSLVHQKLYEGEVKVVYSQRINYSLVHARCQHVISSVTLPKGMTAQIRIAPDFSEALHVNEGSTENLSPVLKAGMFARLSSPILNAELLVTCGETVERLPIEVSPLYACDQRRENAAAMVVFVLENDPLVLRTLDQARAHPDPEGNQRPVIEVAELLYEQLRFFFAPNYYYQRDIFRVNDLIIEQAVRFPAQIKSDLGGTC